MAPQRKFIDNVRDMFDLRDVYHDVVNFSESNRDRAVRKLERIKGVFTAMRYGMQAPLSTAVRLPSSPFLNTVPNTAPNTSPED